MPIPTADERPVLRAVLMRVRRDTPTPDTVMLCSALESRLDAEQSAERPPPNPGHQVVRLVPPAGIEPRPVGMSNAERVRRHRERKRREAEALKKQG